MNQPNKMNTDWILLIEPDDPPHEQCVCSLPTTAAFASLPRIPPPFTDGEHVMEHSRNEPVSHPPSPGYTHRNSCIHVHTTVCIRVHNVIHTIAKLRAKWSHSVKMGSGIRRLSERHAFIGNSWECYVMLLWEVGIPPLSGSSNNPTRLIQQHWQTTQQQRQLSIRPI